MYVFKTIKKWDEPKTKYDPENKKLMMLLLIDFFYFDINTLNTINPHINRIFTLVMLFTRTSL